MVLLFFFPFLKTIWYTVLFLLSDINAGHTASVWMRDAHANKMCVQNQIEQIKQIAQIMCI